MKPLYVSLLFTVVLICLVPGLQKLMAQCPVGYPPGSTAYDTTIVTPTGFTSLQIKFPQFDPQEGMLTCVRLCIAITGVVDSISVENNSTSAETADVFYIRTDQITGPGLSTPLTNSITHHYGPYGLGPTDGILGSGPDFISISHDTILNAAQVCRTLTDSALIAAFYGHDSVTYNYNITALTNVSSSGNYNNSVATSAFVRFRFEYCTCPGYTLPVNIYQFTAHRVNGNKAELKWMSYDNSMAGNYRYEAEMSRNGRDFETISVFPISRNSNSYGYLYDLRTPGRYFFRIKQIYEDGRLYLSSIKYVDAEDTGPAKFIVYPNPSNGIVGIKFDNNSAGKYLVLINNAQGQTVVNKEIEVYGNSYQQLATLQTGSYWIKLSNVASGLSSVSQILIK